MNGILNESTLLREYDFNKPDVHKLDSLIDNSIRYFHNNKFPYI